MTDAMEGSAPRRTRIQQEKRELILEAALEVFSTNGFRGSTIDQIAEAAECRSRTCSIISAARKTFTKR